MAANIIIKKAIICSKLEKPDVPTLVLDQKQSTDPLHK